MAKNKLTKYNVQWIASNIEDTAEHGYSSTDWEELRAYLQCLMDSELIEFYQYEAIENLKREAREERFLTKLGTSPEWLAELKTKIENI